MGVVGRLGQALRGVARGVTSVLRDPLREARRLEAAGDLESATARFLEAGSNADASRLYALRAESTGDAEARCRLLAQAAASATGALRSELRLRRAALVVDLARDGRFQLGRSELQELARELETLGQPALAARAYDLAGDVEGQTEALVEAGCVERLEEVLDAQQQHERSERRRIELERQVQDLHRSGRRREAIAVRQDPVAARLDGVLSVLREVELRRVRGPLVSFNFAHRAMEVAFGDDVTIGRGGTSLVVPASSLSRRHLLVRHGDRGPEALDLGSSNGTTLGGARLDVPAVVPETGQLELVLGGEVPVTLERWLGGVRLDLASRTIHAPLGPLLLDGMCVEMAPDGWLDLSVVEGALYLHDLRVGSPVQLCRGDTYRREAGGEPLLEVFA